MEKKVAGGNNMYDEEGFFRKVDKTREIMESKGYDTPLCRDGLETGRSSVARLYHPRARESSS